MTPKVHPAPPTGAVITLTHKADRFQIPATSNTPEVTVTTITLDNQDVSLQGFTGAAGAGEEFIDTAVTYTTAQAQELLIEHAPIHVLTLTAAVRAELASRAHHPAGQTRAAAWTKHVRGLEQGTRILPPQVTSLAEYSSRKFQR